MTWLAGIGEPLGKTREEVEAYISGELQRAIPNGGSLRSTLGPGPSWTIQKERTESGMPEDYGVMLSQGFDFIIFTHGNNDIGPMDLHNLLLMALVIDAAALRHSCLERLTSECKPNRWGYT